MLRQLVYHSKAQCNLSWEDVDKIVASSQQYNLANNITGLLLYDGARFCQVLEGDENEIQALYRKIEQSTQHHNVVKVCDEIIKERTFSNWNLHLITLKNEKNNFYWVPNDLKISRDGKLFHILNNFATWRWEQKDSPTYPPFSTEMDEQVVTTLKSLSYEGYRFAYQPIVDTTSGRYISLEALLRDDTDRFPFTFLNQLATPEKHEFDLKSKTAAIANLSEHLPADASISINLMPGALTYCSNVSSIISDLLSRQNLQPEQIYIEVTENEIVEQHETFITGINHLRKLGIKVAIDDFGAGYAGLSLLAKFLPDKIKIDRVLIDHVDKSGPKQAIVRALIEFSLSMGIPLVAEGVERYEEWHWLSAEGIRQFQGYLFAKPLTNQIPVISWQNIMLNGPVGKTKQA